ncbi:MAG: hypothetical protein MHM6MM_004051 [Cercozoa sp. M6MM]
MLGPTRAALRQLNTRRAFSLARGEQRVPLQWAVGDQVRGFQVVSVDEVPEQRLRVYQLQCQSTGARLMHVDASDTNNCFAVSFRTPPSDSTGVAHILEHTALCGSKKYPVRDPFFNMLKRSLNSFMNAFTAPDWTAYPFSSQNAQDFDNLLQVYLDAAFFPLLDERDFRQEGHRFELQDSDKVALTGVVYNEMKGAMSDAGSVFLKHIGAALFCDDASPYRHNSGGEPRDIPDLTYEQFRQFHARCYHPSNACFFTYGDLPPTAHLERLRGVLDQFDRIDPGTEVTPVQAPMSAEETSDWPRRVEVTGPPDASQGPQTRVGTFFVCNDVALMDDDGVVEQAALSLASDLLMEGADAPFYNRLIVSQLASDYAPGNGYSGYDRQPTFGVAVQGVKEDNVAQVEQVIRDVLQQLDTDDDFAERVFAPHRVDTSLHEVECAMKHVRADFGLRAFLGTVNSRTHGNDRAAVTTLSSAQLVARVRQRLAEQPDYLRQLVRKWMKNNARHVTVVQRADPEYQQRSVVTPEEARVQQMQQYVDAHPEEKQRLRELSQQLQEHQESEQNVDMLPTVTLADIPAEGVPEHVTTQDGICVANAPTNGLVYARLAFDLSGLPEHLRQLLPLFAEVADNMGTETKSWQQLLDHKRRTVRHASAATSLTAKTDGDMQHILSFSMSALTRNAQDGVELVQELLLHGKYDDEERLAMLLQQKVQRASAALQESGHSFATTRAISHLPGQHATLRALTEEQSGLSQVQFLNETVHADHAKLAADLAEIARYLREQTPRIMAVGDDEALAATLPALRTLGALFGTEPVHTAGTPSDDSDRFNREFFTLPSSAVNYVAAAVPVPGVTSTYCDHPDVAALEVLSKLMSRNVLHRELREKGGAYGGGMRLSHSASGGALGFFSFRDPLCLESLARYRIGAEWAATGDYEVRDVQEAQLMVFQDVDAPMAPSQHGVQEFLHGTTDAMRNRRRERLLQVNKDDVQRVAQRYLSPLLDVQLPSSDDLRERGAAVFEQTKETMPVVVLGAAETLQALDNKSDDWHVTSLGASDLE